ncbi:MAG TPA: hypothetical protein VMU75_10815 [Acidimicrobiales bacterium]|nr:hypothetical protein [Acidimicrobiales bacterium]
MIIVRVERWPDDADPDDLQRERRRHTDIARAVIRNDHSGSTDSGNYDVTVYDPPPYNPWGGVNHRTRIQSFPRQELGVWDLIHSALEATSEDRRLERESSASGAGPLGGAASEASNHWDEPEPEADAPR